MSLPKPDSTTAQTLLTLIGSRRAEVASDLEREVVALYDGYRTRLLAYVGAFGITGHDSEEIVQEVFLALFRHLCMGKSRSNLRSWLFRVAHNLALKQRQIDQRWYAGAGQSVQDVEDHCDPSPNPEEHAVSAQRQRLLSSVVSALPEQDRMCLYLRAEGLRYREIANVLGISLGSVSISLTRSMARLLRADEARRLGTTA
jgi:RNA polymerase sigma-70 factor (ECF subfamily)